MSLILAQDERKLRMIRQYALRRSQMILQTYTYLRDSKSDDKFTSPAILTKICRKLQESFSGQPKALITDGGNRTVGPKFKCGHCHGEYHSGGKAHCPLLKVKLSKARCLGPEIDVKLAQEPLSEEELEKYLRDVVEKEITTG